MKILIFKGQICLHLQTRALTIWPKQFLEADRIESTNFEDGTTDMFSKIQFMLDLSSRDLRNQLHSSQYGQLILLLLFIGESTPLSINTLVQLSNHSLKRICCCQISQESRQEGLQIFWGQKMSHILLMTHLGKQLRRYVMINLISRDLITNSFQRMIRRCQKRVELKGILSQMNSMCDFGAPLTIGLT